MNGFVDIHSHLIYGIDDGPQTREDMFRLIDQAYKDHIRCIYATPHCTPGVHHFDEALYLRHMEFARSYIGEKDYNITLRTGAECLYTPAFDSYIAEHDPPVLEDTNYVLLEFVPDVSRREMEHALSTLIDYGYVPFIAHIERYAVMRSRYPYQLKERYPVRYQVNGDMIFPRNAGLRRRIHRWVQDGLIDHFATDMHSIEKRPPELSFTHYYCREYFPSVQTGPLFDNI